MSQLEGKNILITGGSSGIGQAIAIQCAQAGASNVAFSFQKNKEGALQTLEEINKSNCDGIMLEAELANSSSVYNLANEAIEQLGQVDILINNAGTLTRHASCLEITLAAYEVIQAVNLRAPFILIQEFAKHMKKQNIAGSILNISSMSAEITTPGLMHYESSKAGLNALTKAAASDLAPYQIRVNAIAPGLVRTNINDQQRESDPDAWNSRQSKIPLDRVGSVNDIANLAVFLVSDKNAWMTGSIVHIDGGLGIASPFAKRTPPRK